MKFCFGDIVVVERELIGVVVKSYIAYHEGKKIKSYDVYVRTKEEIVNYKENEIVRYMVRHKCLNSEEKLYQYDALHGKNLMY